MDDDWFMRRIPRFEKAHPRFSAAMHLAGGIWLLVLVALLYGYHRAGWWTPLLVPAAVGHLYAAYRLQQLADAGNPPPAAA